MFCNNLPSYEKITCHEASKALRKLILGKAYDLRDISAEHLKYAKSAIVEVLTSIFNGVLQTGQIPKQFKEAHLPPIHKKGKGCLQKDNYRGLFITSMLSKTIEYIILSRTKRLLRQNPLQFGFTEGSSPLFAVLMVPEAIAEAKDRRGHSTSSHWT